jgi:hypothetical protein
LWAGDRDVPARGYDRGYIVLAPDNTETNSVGVSADELVLECLSDARKRFSVDSDRIFLTGFESGADAAFELGLAHPDEFAGVLLIGGNIHDFGSYCWENGNKLAWYVIGRGYDHTGMRGRDNNRVFEKMLKHGGSFDFMLVNYLGRDGETVTDDISQSFEWMDLHARQDMPSHFRVSSLRRADSRFFWVSADRLPRESVIPTGKGSRKIAPMPIEARVTSDNTIHLKSPSNRYSIRLMPGLVDFQKRVTVKVGDHVEFSKEVKADAKFILEELRVRGDRTRLPLAMISL